MFSILHFVHLQQRKGKNLWVAEHFNGACLKAHFHLVAATQQRNMILHDP